MITFFATAKPFEGHNAVIQRNAIQSWLSAAPGAEVILFGDDEGTREVADEFKIRNEPDIARTSFGAIRVDQMFLRAQAIARHDVLCYSNCDMIFFADLWEAIQNIRLVQKDFFAAGRRWNLDITSAIDFNASGWRDELKQRTLKEGERQTRWYIDYFTFSRGFLDGDIPPLAVGRVYWDNWMLWKASQAGKPLVDLTPSVIAVHQNHDYRHHPKGRDGVYAGEEAAYNLQAAGGWDHLRTLSDAEFVLRSGKLTPNTKKYWHAMKRRMRPAGRVLLYRVWNPLWFGVLNLTRPLRSMLGLRSAAVRRSHNKV